MRIDTGQHLRLDQRMKLTPRMIQSMEILQLPAQALEERIEQELTNNPTLELREPGVSDPQQIEAELDQDRRDALEGERELIVTDDRDGDRSHKDDFERLSNMSEEYGESWSANNYESDTWDRPRQRAQGQGERDGKLDAMANTAARPQSLTEQLLEQWHLVEVDPATREAGDYLIGYIDNDGYLRTDEKSLLDNAPRHLTREQVLGTIPVLQQMLEPAGLAARDLRECLLLQIESTRRQSEAEQTRGRHRANGSHHPEQADAEQPLHVEHLLVNEYLKDIEVNRLPRIAQRTGLSIEQIKTAIHNLRRFHPHPGRMLVEESPHTIRPDAVIEYDEPSDCYTVRLANDRFPALTISPRYQKLAKDSGADRKTREFVSTNLRSARWLMEAIAQRNNTLLRVISVVVEAQREFFDLGPQHLRPLPMTLVADQLGIHVATVSRAVSEKYMQTPRGIYPLRMFFSGGTETESGESMSWTAVQAKLKEIIDAEDKSDPLNDDQLVEALKKQGIDIARRTVAKYRKQLHIAPARQRREF